MGAALYTCMNRLRGAVEKMIWTENTGRIHEACDVGVELKLKSLRSHRMYMMVNKLPLLTSMHVINRLSWGGFLLRIPLPGTLVVCADAFRS